MGWRDSYRAPPVALDTNVLVSGACRREGSFAYAILMGVLEEEIPLVLTPQIVLEYQEVLQRPRIIALTKLDHRQSEELVTSLVALSDRIQRKFDWRPNLIDESDNKFIEAAIHAAATIVTYNSRDFARPDLLQYGWSTASPREFVTRHL